MAQTSLSNFSKEIKPVKQPIKGFRVESPSSINTFKQCPRKYYYQYIEKLPSPNTIHTVRGNIAHSALEYFYDINTALVSQEEYHLHFKQAMQQLLISQWKSYKEKLDELRLTQDQERFYFEETMFMLMNWVNHFIKKIKTEMETSKISLDDAFEKLTPIRENQFKSKHYNVRGYIDAIHRHGNETHILDYKTNKRPEMKESIKLQLAIYAMLYKENFGELPDKVGIFFLREKEHYLSVDEFMVEQAQMEISMIHEHTGSTQNKIDYKRKVTGLCKWRTGQCAFYDVCKPHG